MKNIRYWLEREYMQCDDGAIVDLSKRDNDARTHIEAIEVMDAMLPDMHYYHPATRNSHYTALHCLPVIPGTKWVVSEEVFQEFLDCMPPMNRPSGGFYVREANCIGQNGGLIHSAYYKDGGYYWHCYEEI